MEYQITDEEQTAAEVDALECATRFLSGWQDWNEDDVLPFACDYHGYDHNFFWLMNRVLLGPAVVYLSTGKTV